MPPGSASGKMRAAMLTPSPWTRVVLSNDVAKVQAYAELYLPVSRLGRVAIVQDSLDLHGALGRSQGTWALDEEAVTYGLDLAPTIQGEQFAQDPAMLVQQFESERLVLLRQRAVAHHIGEHNLRRVVSVAADLCSSKFLRVQRVADEAQ